MIDYLFANDGTLLASTRSAVEYSYQQVSKDFALTVGLVDL